ncbi:MAG: VOC family protein [Fimbriimonas sp.]|nr:VOC family protein [Fimbriimonas sp.]
MVLGIHHVTAISGDPQQNVDFYVGVLGLRLVKQTVNFDDPTVYHLYYGDGIGRPGTLMTTFPYGHILPGKRGRGETASITFEVPVGSLDYWATRLRIEVKASGEETIFGKRVVWAHDPDGLRIELEEVETPTNFTLWPDSAVPAEYAIRSIRRVSLMPVRGRSIGEFETTEAALSGMFSFTQIGEEGSRKRFQAGVSEVDVIEAPEEPLARNSAGTVHHIAFRNKDNEVHEKWLLDLNRSGFHTSPIMERDYFRSIYFREPGGVLFEFATDQPGMMKDESEEHLGEALQLPQMHAHRKAHLESVLPKLRIPGVTQ